MFNGNEIGTIENPNLIVPIVRIHDQGDEKSFKLLGVHFEEYLLCNAHISSVCAKFLNLYTASIESKILLPRLH
jgi:hypothetical protein